MSQTAIFINTKSQLLKMSPFSVLTKEDFYQLQNKGCDGEPTTSIDTRYPDKCIIHCGMKSCKAVALDRIGVGRSVTSMRSVA